MTFLETPKDARVLDLACGKGRHALFLNQLGYHVTGIDLSANSIRHASQYESERLHFQVHDMRDELAGQKFDLILNLFTSFGYFNSLSENLKVLQSVSAYASPGATVVVDVFNAVKVRSHLVAAEEKEERGILFRIDRTIKDNRVIKTIEVLDNGKSSVFQECVQLLGMGDFEALFDKTGFHVKHVFGDYNLGTFAPADSDRLILVANKK
jgi:SAM-dependent methyltransferase